MDMITVDVTDVPAEPKAGEMAELMGKHVKVDEVARWSGSIAYEILTRLGSRYHRLYSVSNS
jgi:alanine racemase